MEGVATLEEIERSWSYDDIIRANAVLNMRADIQAQESERQRHKR